MPSDREVFRAVFQGKTSDELLAEKGRLIDSVMADLTVPELIEVIGEINRLNGWREPKRFDWSDPDAIASVLMLIVTEVSEAMEAVRKGDQENFTEELADIVIRVFDAIGGIAEQNPDFAPHDLERTILRKLITNIHRGYKHGGKLL